MVGHYDCIHRLSHTLSLARARKAGAQHACTTLESTYFASALLGPCADLSFTNPDGHQLPTGAVSIFFLTEMDMTNQTDTTSQASANPAASQRGQGKVQKPPRALEPKASAELAAQVLSKMDAYSRKPMIRHEGAGYVVGAVPKNRQPNQPIAVVDGDFGRAEFKAVHAEIEQMGLEFGAFIVVAKTATYSGHRILFSKFEDLGIERVVHPKDDSPSPGM